MIEVESECETCGEVVLVRKCRNEPLETKHLGSPTERRLCERIRTMQAQIDRLTQWASRHSEAFKSSRLDSDEGIES